MVRCGAKLVNYADDFVVLSKREATRVLAQVRKWLGGMKLTLNETKTCIRDARKEHFRFLGYELGPVVSTLTGKTYLGARPSKKALERARREVSRILWRGRTDPWEKIRSELNWFLRGWASYFVYGSSRPAFRKLDHHVNERARNLLRRRHKLPKATGRFGPTELHGKLGVLELQRIPPLTSFK